MKEKKEIKWLGLPPDAEDEMVRLQRQRDEAEQRMARKQLVLQDLVSQHVTLVNLMARNSLPMYSSSESRIYLPFIVVHTGQDTVIDCLMTEVLFHLCIYLSIRICLSTFLAIYLSICLEVVDR